jgi:Ca-activated chloride channel family protein
MLTEFTDTAIEATQTEFELDDELDDEDADTTTDFDPLEAQHRKRYSPVASRRVRTGAGPSHGPTQPTGDVRISVTAGQHAPADGAVLFDSASGAAGQFTFLSVAFADTTITADALDPELTLLLFVGDLAAPRARVKLVDILRLGGRRPLNLRRDAGEPVRLTLEDPSGAWTGGVPALELVLGWKA